ncbi:MAG: 5'/3'-nucleotidase SurE [Trueperaceae bacterium]
MRILVSNDDGVFSPGIRALARVAQEFGQVRVVAPDVEQSAMSHAITVRRPLHYTKTPIDGLEAYRVDGTPADCVALGAHHWDKVDLVLSGVNLGHNLGHNIWHSGTVAAAKQAAFLRIPAIAFSAPYSDTPVDYDVLAPFVREVIREFLAVPDMTLLNANFPTEPRGLMWTSQSVRHYEGYVVPGEDPMGRRHFWFAEEPQEQVEEGTDRWAVERGYVSLTPLRLDLTDEPLLARARAVGEGVGTGGA